MVQHLLTGCKVLANSEYVIRHNRALMILAVSWAKEFSFVENDIKWYKKKWCRGYVLENDHAKLVWEEFEYNFKKMIISRRPNFILVDKEKKILWICDMACLQENNTVTKRDEKRTKYKQLAFAWREQNVIIVVIGAFGGGIK